MPFPPVVDDDGTGTIGTVLDKAFFDAYNAEIAALDTSGKSTYTNAGTVAGGTSDLALPAAAQIRFIQLSPSAALTLRGFTGSAQVGDLVIVRNVGQPLLLQHNGTPGAGGVAFNNFITSGLTPVMSSGIAAYTYNGTVWVLTGHEQGAPYPIPYNAANFTAPPSGTWTVEASDVVEHSIYFKGRVAHLTVLLVNTARGGTAGPTLSIGGWGYTFAIASLPVLPAIALDVAYVLAFVRMSATNMDLFRADLANWSTAPNVYFQVRITAN